MEKRDYLKQMLIYFIDPSMSFLEKHGSCQMEVPELSLIASLLKILNIYLGKYKGVKKLPKKIERSSLSLLRRLLEVKMR
jgi:hypothetical protein